MDFKKIEVRGINMALEYQQQGKYYKVLYDVNIDENVEAKPHYTEYPMMRKVVLRNNPHKDYFINSLAENKRDNAPRKKGKHRGHLIGELFKVYLLTEEELVVYSDEVKVFFECGNKSNVSPQSPEANCNSGEFKGQLGFEQDVSNYLKKTKVEAKVYYEIEEIIEEGEVLGRRIFIHWYNENKEDVHVFIPEERK